MKRGAAYIRVSTDEQMDLSPQSQLDAIRAYAAQQQIDLKEPCIFMEKEGRSGRKAQNRPEFQRMIAAARTVPRPFDVILVWKFSRFARNQDESTFYKGILRKKLGIEVISISEPVMEGMYGRLIELIIEWQDEFYSYNLGAEVRRGMTKKAQQHGYQLPPCLGYAAAGGGRPFLILENEYAAVERIFSLYGETGLDRTAIARRLNEEGFRTKRGRLFDRRSVTRVLENPFYGGTVVWNGLSFPGGHEVKQSVAALYPLCQKRLREEKKAPRRRDASACRHWASGLLRCSVCGASLSYHPDPSGKGGVFTCWKYARGLHREPCSISAARAENAFFRSLDQLFLPALPESGRRYAPSAPDPTEEKARLIRQKKSLEQKRKRIRAAYEAGADSLEEYRERCLRLQTEKEQIEASLCSLNRQTESFPSLAIRGGADLLRAAQVPPAVKSAALRSILTAAIYDRAADQITFCYRLPQN